MITAIDKSTALILIDLQNSIIASPLSHPVEDILNNANKLLEAFRKKSLPVFIVNVNPTGAKWTQTRKDAKPMTLPDNNDWYKITDKLHVAESDIRITKHSWNAFFETALEDELKKRNVTGIVIAGISTSIGVEGTARAASERAYNISFVIDAMTDLQVEAHERSIKHIFPRMGETGRADEIIAALSK